MRSMDASRCENLNQEKWKITLNNQQNSKHVTKQREAPHQGVKEDEEEKIKPREKVQEHVQVIQEPIQDWSIVKMLSKDLCIIELDVRG